MKKAPRISSATAEKLEFKPHADRPRRAWCETDWLKLKAGRVVAPYVLLILPLLLASLGVAIKYAAGPGWSRGDVDPSYAYLIGSLGFTDGEESICCMHPGTFVQVNGSLVITLARYILSEGTARSADGFPINDVLVRPEVYGSLIVFETLLLYVLALVVLGRAVYAVTGDLALSMVAQGCAFLTAESFNTIVWISPETILLAVSTLVAAVVLAYAGQRYGHYQAAIAFGALSGIGLATKITYIPVALLPLLILERWRAKAAYGAVAAGVWLAIVVPHWMTVATTLAFLRGVATHTGLNGTGEAGVLDFATWWRYFVYCVRNDIPLICAILVSGYAALRMGKQSDPFAARVRRSLMAFTCVAALQVLMATKQPTPRYLFPADALIGMVAALVLWVFLKQRPWWARIVLLAMAVFLVAVIVGRERAVSAGVSAAASRDDERKQVLASLDQRYPGYIQASYYAAETLPWALHFGNGFVFGAYSSQLGSLYPNEVFYLPQDARFFTFGGEVSPVSLLATGRPVILRGSGPPSQLPACYGMRLVAQTARDSFYILEAKPSAPGCAR